MKPLEDNDLVVDEFGRLDLDYYLARARAERVKAIVEVFSKLRGLVRIDIKPKDIQPKGTLLGS